MNKTFWAIVGIIVIVFGGILLLKDEKPAASNASDAKPTNHLIGNNTTNVTLVEYGDYQCPFCGTFYPTVKQVQEKYADKIAFQFRNLPLLQIHKNAFAAARAAEAASLQNKFWEMHDLLYTNQNVWSAAPNPNSVFEQYANQLGLNVAQFKTDAAGDKVNDTINADVAEFNKTKERTSTPTFFINGKKANVENTVDSFSKAIDAEIKKQAEAKKP
ncbi:MAG TPA: thioredoxin domain-containing protein [Candidatus Saccharimonadales bacterium]|nr:thioredoxin domain-containing protein [Candidatus Saccharimonadales bacterium]